VVQKSDNPVLILR